MLAMTMNTPKAIYYCLFRLSNMEPAQCVNLYQEQTNVLILGHSFPKKLKNKMFDMMKVAPYLTMASILKCNEMAEPWVHGRSGKWLKDLPDLVQETKFWQPSILILELGSNDLTHPNTDPKTLAYQMYEQTLYLFDELKNLKLIVLCSITTKTYMWPDPNLIQKEIGIFNADVLTYNDTLTDVIMHDNRYMKWTHRGVSNMIGLTWDGTHLNTPEGFRKHISSMANAIRTAKKESIIRQHESTQGTVTRNLQFKRGKAKERKQRKKQDRATRHNNHPYIQ
jgi:hypothetical protein